MPGQELDLQSLAEQKKSNADFCAMQGMRRAVRKVEVEIGQDAGIYFPNDSNDDIQCFGSACHALSASLEIKGLTTLQAGLNCLDQAVSFSQTVQ